MSERKVELSLEELKTLMEWLAKFESPPRVVSIMQGKQTGIGRGVRAEIETAEGEGCFKDLTDYSNW